MLQVINVDDFLLYFGMLVLILFPIVWILHRQRLNQSQLPPGPPGIPILGNILQLNGDTAAKQFHQWSKIYGPLVSAKFGPDKMLVVNSIETFKEIFVTRGYDFAGRPDGFILRLYSPFRKGIVASDFCKEWKLKRRLTHSCMKAYGANRDKLQEIINLESNVLIKRLRNRCQTIFDPKVDISLAVMNIIATILFGEPYNEKNPEFLNIVDNISTMGTLIAELRIMGTSPFLRLFCQDNIMTTRQCVQWRNKLFLSKLKQHKRTYDHTKSRDFIDEIFKYSKDWQNHHFSETDITMILSDIQFAGFDTTVVTLLWAVLYLAQYPDKQEKLFQQLQAEVPLAGVINYEDRCSLPYLEATLHEVLRKSSIASLTLPHSAVRTVKIMDYKITPDVIILANLYAIHHDERYWKDPDAFLPERFISDTGAFFIPTQSYAPFLGGPRACLGEQIVKMELFVIMGHLFRNFQFIATDRENIHSLPGHQGVVFEPGQFKIKLLNR